MRPLYRRSGPPDRRRATRRVAAMPESPGPDLLAAQLVPYVPRWLAARLPLAPGTRRAGSAVVLYADLAGFTPLSAALAAAPDGAERLGRELTDVFTRLIAAIHAEHGDVVKFAGDSLTAIFPTTTRALAAGAAMQASHRATITTPAGPFQIGLRVGVGAGRITWQIIGNPGREHYWVISGIGLRRAIAAEAAAAPGSVR